MTNVTRQDSLESGFWVRDEIDFGIYTNAALPDLSLKYCVSEDKWYFGNSDCAGDYVIEGHDILMGGFNATNVDNAQYSATCNS